MPRYKVPTKSNSRSPKFTRDYRSLSKQGGAPVNPLGFLSGVFKNFQGFRSTPAAPRSAKTKKPVTASARQDKARNASEKVVAPGLKASPKAKPENESRQPLESVLLGLLVKVAMVPVSLLLWLARPLILSLQPKLTRQMLMKAIFAMVFGILIWRLADISINTESKVAGVKEKVNLGAEILLSSRGQIYISDMSQGKSDIPVTSTRSLAHVFINPAALKLQMKQKIVTVEEASARVAGALNIPYPDVYATFKKETDRDTPLQYVIIAKFITQDQKKAVDFLRTGLESANSNFIAPYSSWLGLENVDGRLYPENQLMANTLGFVPRHYVTRDEAIQAGCKEEVLQNEQRGTVNTFVPGDNSKGQYTVGYYGLEQKYCSLLAGLNGRKPLNKELGSSKEDETKVQNGANLFLTIDRNLQRKAEDVLAQAIKTNTNANGTPKDGAALILDVKTGKILAMASYPSFDPNNFEQADPNGFRNAVTGGDYEVGSVMKPMTVSAVRNEWESGSVDSQGKRMGVPQDWKFDDYQGGKPYQENDGKIFFIRNSQNLVFGRNINLSQVLRDSINTGIAEIQPSIGNRKTREYFEEKFRFGQPTLVDLPGDASGNVDPLTANINSPFTYATHGFGQGFTASPLQLARAYTPIANNGYLVEPYLVDKIVYGDGRVDDGTGENSIIKRPKPEQIISQSVAKEVTGYLVNTVDQGYQGKVHSKGQVPGYTVAGKTGTAQVGRLTYQKKCAADENVYDCNTRLGIFDHTYVGYGPASDPRLLVLIKLGEPQPGVVNNFAENTLGPAFSQLMGYSLEYIGIPKEAGRK